MDRARVVPRALREEHPFAAIPIGQAHHRHWPNRQYVDYGMPGEAAEFRKHVLSSGTEDRPDGCDFWGRRSLRFYHRQRSLRTSPPPVQLGFNNLARLLRADGFVIFTVPWGSEGHTLERYPDLHDWQIVNLRGGPVLVNGTSNGEIQTFRDLCFHGGDGETLEMRLFSKDDLLANLETAGFKQIEFAEIEANPDYGIIWEPWSRGLVARKTPR